MWTGRTDVRHPVETGVAPVVEVFGLVDALEAALGVPAWCGELPHHLECVLVDFYNVDKHA